MEDGPVEDVAQDGGGGYNSEVRSAGKAAFFAGWCARQKTADIRKATQMPILLEGVLQSLK